MKTEDPKENVVFLIYLLYVCKMKTNDTNERKKTFTMLERFLTCICWQDIRDAQIIQFKIVISIHLHSAAFSLQTSAASKQAEETLEKACGLSCIFGDSLKHFYCSIRPTQQRHL